MEIKMSWVHTRAENDETRIVDASDGRREHAQIPSSSVTISSIGWQDIPFVGPLLRSCYPGTTSRFQGCGTEQERFAVPVQAVLAVLWNSKTGPYFLVSRMHIRSHLCPPVLCPLAGLPYRPAYWPNDRQTRAVLHVRPAVIRNQGAGDDISVTKDVSLRTYAVAVANAGFDCATRGFAPAKTRIRIGVRRRGSSPCQSLR